MGTALPYFKLLYCIKLSLWYYLFTFSFEYSSCLWAI